MLSYILFVTIFSFALYRIRNSYTYYQITLYLAIMFLLHVTSYIAYHNYKKNHCIF